MSRFIPLISTGALGPIFDWMERNDSRMTGRLAACDLAWTVALPPERPIPLLPILDLFLDLCRSQGPDLLCRAAQNRGIFQLKPLGGLALASPTVGAAFRQSAIAMPRHCTHEILTVERDGDDLVIRDLWTLPFPDEAAHAVQQYVAAIVFSLLRLGSRQVMAQVTVAMRPHPVAGLDHLKPWFGTAVTPSPDGTLAVRIPKALAESPMASPARVSYEPQELDWPRLRAEDTLAGSVRLIVRSMLGSEIPTIKRLARYAAMSNRSFQRRLAVEGTSFSEIVDEERRRLALAEVVRAHGTLGDLATDLGYSGQPSLTRAFRRWTGMAPSRFDRK